jgi:hypothetical protein
LEIFWNTINLLARVVCNSCAGKKVLLMRASPDSTVADAATTVMNSDLVRHFPIGIRKATPTAQGGLQAGRKA